jgi:alkanesulfonate monooxygenase SsuD/methylene tetrahydromethanopterin reductase-like flavin-dependent oxidoreductase (luciferase family)
VTFEGQFDHIDRACINPRPTRRIPIWFGGFSELVYRRAARLGDGFIFTGSQERSTEAWKQMEKYLREAGREPAQFGKEIVVGRFDQTPQALAARVEWCRESGFTHVAIDTMGKGFSTAEAHLQFLSEVRQKVGRS